MNNEQLKNEHAPNTPGIFHLGNVLTISLAHLFHDIFSSFLSPLLPLLIEKLSINYTSVSFLTVVQRIPSLLNPFIGIIADKIHVRYLIIIAPSITAISMSLLGSAPNYTVLAILLFVMGISASLFHVPAPVMIKKFSANKIGKGMSFYMLGGEIARTIGPLIIVGAVTLWGLEGTYKLIPFGIIASFILYFRFRKINISDELKSKKEKVKAVKIFKKYLPLFLILSGFVFFRAFMKTTLSIYIPTYLKNVKGESFVFGGISFAIYQLSGVFGTYLSGTISDKIGKKTTLIIISLVTPILMWLFVVTGNNFKIPILILLGFFIIAQSPILLAIVNDIESDRPAFVNGIYMTISFTIGAIAIMFIGIISDRIGLENTFKISAILALGSIPFVLKLPDDKQN